MRQVTLTLGRSSDRLLSAAAVVVAVLLYLAVHFAVRLAMGPTLGLDDAEQALFAQEWSWGYRFRQPPLFTWLLLGLGEVVGVNALALSLLRYALLAVTYICLYLVALRWIADRRLAALAVFSFALIYVFAFYAHHDLTHTTALGALVAASLYAFARLVEWPTAPAYAALGVCFGLGMLAKWNFVMLPAGLLLTCLLLPRFRGLVLTWRTLLTVGAMAAVVAPTALWILAHGQTVGSVSEDILAAEGEAPGFLATLAEGTLALLKSALVFPQPFLPIFLAVFGGALWRAVRAPAPVGGGEAPAVTPEFLGALIAVTLGLHWLLVPTLGAVTFTERWMHPALMALPVFLFALAERGRPGPRAVTVYLVVVAVFVAGALGARIVRYGLGADYCGKCRELVPFGELAAQLRAAGFERGTIVTDGFHVGGNLRVAFPDSRVIDPAYPPEVWPEASGAGDDGQCLAAWWADDGHADELRARIDAYLTGVLGVAPDAPHVTGRAEALMRGSETRTYTLAYELFPRGAGDCR